MAEATTQTLDAKAYAADGTARERVALPATLFDGTVNMPVMHQAVKAYLANQRQGNASTKTRRWVTGGNQKPWRQKGTGRARQGSIRAPHWVGGGTVFGPHPRSYAQYVPRQVRALARKSAFNARAREGAIFVIDRLAFETPKTAQMLALIERLGLAGRKVLLLTDGVNRNAFLSARNVGTLHVMPYADVSTYHILWSDAVLVEAAALGERLEPVAEREERTDEARTPRTRGSARKGATRRTATAGRTTKGRAAPKTAAAKATKKPAPKKSAKKAAAPKRKRK